MTAGGPSSEPERVLAESLLSERPLRGARRVVARRLAEAHRDCVPVTLHRDLDVGALAAVPESAATIVDHVLLAIVRTLQGHPQFNATFDAEVHRTYRSVHLGIAVATERGLLVPVLRGAESLDPAALRAARRSQAERALAWRHSPDELLGGTFTVTNLGPLGIDRFTPIVNPPQVAILGLGRIRRTIVSWQPTVEPVERTVLPASLTFDHRVNDGADAARFLESLQQALHARACEASADPCRLEAGTTGRPCGPRLTRSDGVP